MSRRFSVTAFPLAVGLAVALSGCGGSPPIRVADAHPGNAPDLIEAYGCGACHTIPGIHDATADVGPSLGGISKSSTIAGVLPNTPKNLIHWLMEPQQISPGTIMPDLGLGEQQARDIAAYLYSH
jgi:cytochrome c2